MLILQETVFIECGTKHQDESGSLEHSVQVGQWTQVLLSLKSPNIWNPFLVMLGCVRFETRYSGEVC